MNRSTRKQSQYVNAVLAVAGIDSSTPLGLLSKSWWKNPINPTSLRLTKIGYQWFTAVAKLVSYDIDLGEQKIMPKQLLQLESLFCEPYYILNLTTIIVFSEQDAIMLRLNSGDLATYLDNLESTR